MVQADSNYLAARAIDLQKAPSDQAGKELPSTKEAAVNVCRYQGWSQLVTYASGPVKKPTQKIPKNLEFPTFTKPKVRTQFMFIPSLPKMDSTLSRLATRLSPLRF